MRIAYSITGTLVLPEGTRWLDGSENTLILPTGEHISVHPVVEMSDRDDPGLVADANTSVLADVGVEMEDYDRSTEEL